MALLIFPLLFQLEANVWHTEGFCVRWVWVLSAGRCFWVDCSCDVNVMSVCCSPFRFEEEKRIICALKIGHFPFAFITFIKLYFIFIFFKNTHLTWIRFAIYVFISISPCKSAVCVGCCCWLIDWLVDWLIDWLQVVSAFKNEKEIFNCGMNCTFRVLASDINKHNIFHNMDLFSQHSAFKMASVCYLFHIQPMQKYSMIQCFDAPPRIPLLFYVVLSFRQQTQWQCFQLYTPKASQPVPLCRQVPKPHAPNPSHLRPQSLRFALVVHFILNIMFHFISCVSS